MRLPFVGGVGHVLGVLGELKSKFRLSVFIQKDHHHDILCFFSE